MRITQTHMLPHFAKLGSVAVLASAYRLVFTLDTQLLLIFWDGSYRSFTHPPILPCLFGSNGIAFLYRERTSYISLLRFAVSPAVTHCITHSSRVMRFGPQIDPAITGADLQLRGLDLNQYIPAYEAGELPVLYLAKLRHCFNLLHCLDVLSNQHPSINTFVHLK